MSEVTLVLGGIRSGKSAFAERLAAAPGPRVLYVATAIPADEEMRLRVERHQRRRPPEWGLIEAGLDLDAAIASATGPWDAVLVDSISGWLANLLMDQLPKTGAATDGLSATIEAGASSALQGLVHWSRGSNTPLVLVSDEVGLSLVSPNHAGRTFQDVLGSINQWLAAEAESVYLIAAGLPLRLKGVFDPTGPPIATENYDPVRR
jgi:adenosylcobinamide kinase/adenosylcobinamide-phosphate guanylyltransferase